MKSIGLSAVVVASFWNHSVPHLEWEVLLVLRLSFHDTARELKAGFTCRNHFAHFLVLGLAMLLAWVMLERHSQIATLRFRPTLAGEIRIAHDRCPG